MSGPRNSPMKSLKEFTGANKRLAESGAYTPPGQIAMLDINKKMERHLAGIHNAVTRNGGAIGRTRY